MAWVHGDRVVINGKPGIVLMCRKRGGGSFLRVKHDDGTWDWPDHALVESKGSHRCRCGECDNPFLSNDSREVVCPNCERRFDRAVEANDSGTRNLRASLRGARTPASIRLATPEELADAAEQRRRDEEESPF